MRQSHKETNVERDKKSDENAIGKASKSDITDEVKRENMGNRMGHMSVVRSSVNAADPFHIKKEPVPKAKISTACHLCVSHTHYKYLSKYLRSGTLQLHDNCNTFMEVSAF